MEKNERKLRVKKKSKFSQLLENKKTRYIIMVVLMLPFLIAIGIFGTIVYREAKGLMNMVSGNTKTKDENLVSSMNYVLRDNATDLQKEYFAQLKSAIEDVPAEGEEPVDDLTIAELVAKCYIADFYTWTNKQGQYDVGGMYYIYDGRFENNDNFKENVYLAARDGFYKYISNYITQYGTDKLIEVESIETTSQKAPWKYVINEHVKYEEDGNGDWIDVREDREYDAYLITCRWTYKEGSSLNLNQFPTTINLLVIKNDNRFSVIEASESKINERVKAEIEDSESVEELEDSDE